MDGDVYRWVQELERVRGAVLEEVMAAISRCTDQAQRFVLVEGRQKTPSHLFHT